MHSSVVRPSSLSPVVDRAVLGRLQRCRAYPPVSLLLTTTPGPFLASRDVIRLQRLLLEAQRRLGCELASDDIDDVLARVRQLAVGVRRVPAGRGVALFANASHSEAVQLAVAVEDRVVVDPTFATRDLARSLRANPRYRLLVLAEQGCRLYEGRFTGLSEVTTDGFPVASAPMAAGQARSHRLGRERSDRRDALQASLRTIDAALEARRARDPLPLVVAGVARQLALYRARSSEAGSIVGTISGSHGRTTPARLAVLAAPVIEAAGHARGADALARLEIARNRGRLVEGIDAVWVAAVERRVGLLCVEETFALPARVAPGGRRLTPAADIDHPEVFDDTVDELIEMVSNAGGEVAIVEDAALASHQRVTALLCEPSGRR